MTSEGNHRKKVESFASANMTLAAVAGQVGCVTLLSVFGALFLGLYLDRLFGTRPIILLILVLSSAPLALFLTYHIAMRAIREANLKMKITEETKSGEETKQSE